MSATKTTSDAATPEEPVPPTTEAAETTAGKSAVADAGPAVCLVSKSGDKFEISVDKASLSKLVEMFVAGHEEEEGGSSDDEQANEVPLPEVETETLVKVTVVVI